ncbi:MAG: hypothetical protein HQL21_06785 [Candidatus Omnitrophica bacterium]|nr:hypothetical protein [Candidatus Omnitrophota bacterium]
MKIVSRIPPILFWIFAGIITVTVGLYFRLYPFYRNVSSDAYEKSTLIVLSRIRASIAEQVNQKFPSMPASQKEQTVQAMFNKVIKEDNVKVRKAFDDLGMKILENTKEKKHYLLESDSYYFLSLTQNILEKGDVSPQIKGSQYFNNLMLAPIGYWEPQTWHPYVGAWVYRIIHLFNPDADIAYGVAFTSPFLVPFVVGAFFLTCWAMGLSWFPSLIASIFFILAEIYLKRSTYGWYDNDSYNVLFPLLAIGLLLATLRNLENRKKAITFGILCAASISLYTKFWYGWSFLWVLIMASLGAVFLKNILFKESQAKKTFHISITVLVASILGMLIMYGPQEIVKILAFAWGELQKFTKPAFNGWPDLFIVVGELKHGTIEDIVQFTGGAVMFTGALLTLLLATVRLVRKRIPSDAITVLALFMAVTLFLSFGAQRFTILLLTPIGLLFALLIHEIWEARNNPGIQTTTTPLTILIASLLLISSAFPIITSERTIRSLLNPIFNSAWERALIQLRDKTPENSVIDNWWSPGHFIKGVAKRRVIFDGASIRGDIGYWLTRVYLSQTEEEALGILRMMNTSSNSAAEYLEKEGLPLSKIVSILTEALGMNKPQALEFYKKILSPRMAEDLIKLTHNVPPPSYMLIYNENVDGNVLLAYMGKWDFKRIEELNSHPDMLKKIPAKGSKNYIDFLWSLVGGPFRQGTPQTPVGQTGTKLVYPDGVTIDTSDMSVMIDSRQYGHGIPQSIFYIDGNNIREKKLENASLSYSVIFYRNENEPPRCALMDHVLANSLLMKLYYFEGKGLTHFKPFAKEADLTGRTKIYIYEIKWPEAFKK